MKNDNLNKDIERSLLNLNDKREAIRTEIKNKCIRYVFFPLMLTVGLFYYYRETYIEINEATNYFATFVLIFISIVFAIFVCSNLFLNGRKQYEKIYKDELVSPLMTTLYPGFDYEPWRYIAENEFNNSGLYNKNYNLYNGDDYFSGNIDNIAVEFSELKVQLNKKGSDTSEASHTNSIFSGIFLHAVISNPVAHKIVIDPILFKDSTPIPNLFKNFILKFLPDYGKVVKTGNADFDENFKLHCDDENEAHRVITPDVVNSIVDIANKMNEYHAPKHAFSQYIPMGVMLKMSVIHNSYYFAINGIELFKIQFGKNPADSKEDLVKSLLYLSMLTDLMKKISKTQE